MADAVCGVLRSGSLVLLGLRSPEDDACPNCWDLIGGHVENGESLLAALARELREEIGVTPLTTRRLGTVPDAVGANGLTSLLHLYEILEWVGEPRVIAPEHTALQWFTAEEACGLPNLALKAYVPFLARP